MWPQVNQKAGFLFIFYFIYQKTDEATVFLFLFDQTKRDTFLFILSIKNANNLILASEKNEATFFKSEKDR